MYESAMMIRENTIDLTAPTNKVYFILVGVGHTIIGIVLISFALYLHFFIMHNTCEHCFHSLNTKDSKVC